MRFKFGKHAEGVAYFNGGFYGGDRHLGQFFILNM